MSYLSIEGGAPLHGELTIQGSKNSVLPVLAATILARDVCRIENCPRLRDVDASVAILRHLGCCVRRDGTALEVDTAPMARCDIPDELMREMRSSIIFLGAILARQGEAVLSYPGGCDLLWEFVWYYTPSTMKTHDKYALMIIGNERAIV